MKIFLTGATGFVGLYLLKRLVGDGHAVRALVRSDADAHTIGALGGEPIHADLLDLPSIERCVAGIEVIVHCGGLPSETEEELFFRSNTLGSFLLLERARLAGVQQFIFISSILVYGLDQAVYLPVDEKHPVAPREQAGTYKVAIETYCQYYQARYGMNTSVYRLGAVFGEVRKKQYGWPDMIAQARRGQDLHCPRKAGIMAVSATDVAALISLAVGDPDVSGQIFNVVDFYNEAAVAAQRLIEIGGFNSRVVVDDSNIEPFIISNEKIRRAFDYTFAGRQRFDAYLAHLIGQTAG
jgi:nucleoside-diphosphate-sugar epimerase